MKPFWENRCRSFTGLLSFDTGANAKEMEAGNDYLRWMADINEPIRDTNELKQYSNEPILSRTLAPWKRHFFQRQRFSPLSVMATDVFFILAMSSEPERVFSGANRPNTDDWGSMKEKKSLEAVECLKSWFSRWSI